VILNWDEVPTELKKITKVKKVPFENNPNDKGLLNIIIPFLGKDDLRPVFSAINFDKNGITVTDAHKLMTLPYPNPKLNGIYEVIDSKKQKKIGTFARNQIKLNVTTKSSAAETYTWKLNNVVFV
jgi:hypothetical protein